MSVYISEYDGSRFGYEEERDSYDLSYEMSMEPDWREEEHAEAMAYFACELEEVERAIEYMSTLEQCKHPYRHIIISCLKDRELQLNNQMKE